VYLLMSVGCFVLPLKIPSPGWERGRVGAGKINFRLAFILKDAPQG